MPSIISGFEYDIFISYRQNDNKYDHWVTEFVNKLKLELEATVKGRLSIYFDENREDGILISSILAIGLHSMSYLIGATGMTCLFAFIVWVILSKKILVEGERTSIVAHIWKMRNKSIVVLVASLVVGLYFALNRSNFIPPLYTSEKPAGYLELVKQSEEGNEKTEEDGNLYKLFDDRYQSFIQKYDR